MTTFDVDPQAFFMEGRSLLHASGALGDRSSNTTPGGIWGSPLGLRPLPGFAHQTNGLKQEKKCNIHTGCVVLHRRFPNHMSILDLDFAEVLLSPPLRAPSHLLVRVLYHGGPAGASKVLALLAPPFPRSRWRHSLLFFSFAHPLHPGLRLYYIAKFLDYDTLKPQTASTVPFLNPFSRVFC